MDQAYAGCWEHHQQSHCEIGGGKRIYQHLFKLSSAELANRRVNSGVQFRNAASQNRSKFTQRWEDQSL
jgi:hypothetical protein